MDGTKIARAEAVRRVREHFERPDAALSFDRERGEGNGDDKLQGMCMYRLGEFATSPVRCAFGVLIPDELYEPVMEGKDARSVTEEFPQLEGLFSEDALGLAIGNPGTLFLVALQRVHDNVAADPQGTVEDFLAALKTFELMEGLA